MAGYWRVVGDARCIPVYALDAGDVRLIAGFCYRLVWIWFWIWLFLGVGGGDIFCDAVWWHSVCDCRVIATRQEEKKRVNNELLYPTQTV